MAAVIALLSIVGCGDDKERANKAKSSSTEGSTPASKLNDVVVFCGNRYALTETTARCSDPAVTDLAPLRRLTQLKYVFLDNAGVSDLTPLSSLPKLTSIMGSNTKVADLSPLSKMTQLTSLHLNGSDVKDLGPLRALRAMEGLSLVDTPVADISPLAGLINLKHLYLTRTQVADIGPIANLRMLKNLGIGGTEIKDISVVAKLSVRYLYLMYAPITDFSPITRATSEVSLDRSQLAAFSKLKRFPSVINLYTDSLFSMPERRAFKKRFPGVSLEVVEQRPDGPKWRAVPAGR